MKAIAYTRVSTQEQADSGLSLDAQARRIAAYCDAQEWDLVEIIRDEGFSAATLKRPGMDRALEAVRKRQADVIVVLKLDRLTRSVKDLGTLLEAFDRGGVAFTSVSDNFDTTTANGRLVLHILGSVAEWERSIISERTSGAMAEAKAQGRRVGAVPFGFTLGEDGETLEPDTDRLATVAEIGDLRRGGATLRAIAAHLNNIGVATAQGAAWTATQVSRILSNSIYTPYLEDVTAA